MLVCHNPLGICVRGYEHCKSTGNLVPGVGAENLYMKGVGMLVVSLRGVNFRFWSHLGCSGENAIMCGSYVAMSVLFRVSHKEYKKNCVFNVLNMVFFRGQ